MENGSWGFMDENAHLIVYPELIVSRFNLHCIETCWRLYLPSLYGDGAEFQRCLKHCRGF